MGITMEFTNREMRLLGDWMEEKIDSNPNSYNMATYELMDKIIKASVDMRAYENQKIVDELNKRDTDDNTYKVCSECGGIAKLEGTYEYGLYFACCDGHTFTI